MHEPDPRIDVRDLYERYGRALYRRCQYLLRDDERALDAMHEVFLKVVERHAEFKGEAAPLTWLVRITTNYCLNLLRSDRAAWRQRYEATLQVDLQPRPDAAAELVARRERAALVARVLERADPAARAAAVFYWVDEMTQHEAARAAGCSVPTLRKRLRAFLKTAKRVLRDEELRLRLPEDS